MTEKEKTVPTRKLVPCLLVLVLLCGASLAANAANAATAAGSRASAAGGAVARAGICVWSCQQNPSGSWAYWFSRALSDCAVTDCLPRGGSSPSGTPCDPGDPDIPGDCRAAAQNASSASLLAGLFSPAPVCAAR